MAYDKNSVRGITPRQARNERYVTIAILLIAAAVIAVMWMQL